MSLFDKIKNTLTEQSNSGSGKKKVQFGSGAKGEFASGSPSMGGEDKTYVKKGKKPLKGKNVKPGQTTGTSQPKRGATTIRQTGQTNLFTGKVEKPQQVKVKTTYQKKTTKPIRVNPDQAKLNLDSPRQIVKNLDKRDGQIKKLDQQIIKPKSGDAQRTDKFIKRKQKSYDIQSKSALNKAKKYAAGGYPKIGGGGLKPDIKSPVKGTTPVKTNISKLNVDKIFSDKTKTKSSSTVVPKNITAKSKGSTPVKTNISKVNVNKIFDKPKNPVTKTIGVKQSDVSKKAKEFTAKVNKANVKVQKNFVGRKANRVKGATLGKKTGSLRKGNLSFPGDRSGAYQATKSDIETRKGFKGKPGGLKADEKNPFVKTDVRKARATKLGGNIYDQPKFDQKKFEKGLQQTKKSKTFKTPPDPFKASNTKTGSAIKDFKFQPRDISTSQAEKKASKSFAQFNKDLKKAGANIDIEKKVNNPSYRIGSRTSSSGGGGRPPRKINKKYKQGNLFDPPSGGSSSGGGGKPPRTPKGGPLVPPGGSGGSGGSGGVDPDGVFKGKIPNKGGFSKKQFKKIRKDYRKDRKKQFKEFMKQLKKSKVKGSGAYSSGATVASRYKRRYGKGVLKTITRAAAKHPKTAAIALGLGVIGGGYVTHQVRKAIAPKGFNAYDNSTYAGSVVKSKSGKLTPIKYTFGKKNKDNNDVPYRIKNPKSQKFISDKLKSGDFKIKNMSKNK